jgi:hypothetical protein
MVTAPKRKRQSSKPVPAPGDATNPIVAWEDDPGSGVVVNRPIPDLSKKPLAYSFPRPVPKAGTYAQGTPEFRYWTAAEALRRGADFWATRVPLTDWQVGSTLKVLLDEGQDLNAYYDRQALNFFHGPSPQGTVYSGESPDIVCHEMGHAILDSFKPELWGAGSQEAAAFHEAFADISALLSAIQLPSLRSDILTSTGGKLYQNSRLSRLAEQLGAAIRARFPGAVDPDCLRNAVNSFTYQDPTTLPSSSPASQLSSEPHSFSRLFTGAFFEMLGASLTAKAKKPGAPTDAELVSVSNDLADILVAGVKAAPVVPNWYAQVAANMVLASSSFDAAYGPIIKAVFVRRAIMSLHSASGMTNVSRAAAAFAPARAAVKSGAKSAAAAGLATVGLPAAHYGIEGVLFVEAASQPRPFLVTGASFNAAPIEPVSGTAAAQAFVDDLFTRGRVDYGDTVEKHLQIEQGDHLKTHRLVKAEGGVRLQRRLFDCGLCMR